MEQTPKLWQRLNKYAEYLETRFDSSFERYEEPKMNNLNFKNWNDTFWCSNVIRKCHLKTIIPEDNKGLWLMHVNVFPRESVELPILGFDIVASTENIAGAFMDFSPLFGFPHPYSDYMERRIDNLEWNNTIELPPWAREIFSEDAIAVGNIDNGVELDQFIQATTDLIDFYIENLEENTFVSNRDTLPLLNRYCQNKKMDPRLHSSILAMGVSEEDKNDYINNILFEEI